MLVIPLLARSKAAWTNASEVESKSEVASQRRGWSAHFIHLFLSIHFLQASGVKKNNGWNGNTVFFSQLAPRPTVRSGDFSPWHGRWRSVGVAHHSVVLPSIPHGQTIACGKGSFKAMTPAIPQRQSETPWTLWGVHNCISRLWREFTWFMQISWLIWIWVWVYLLTSESWPLSELIFHTQTRANNLPSVSLSKSWSSLQQPSLFTKQRGKTIKSLIKFIGIMQRLEPSKT